MSYPHIIPKSLSYLRRHPSIDPMTALNELGIYRLAARIEDLRARGHWITTSMIRTGVRGKDYAIYALLRDAERDEGESA